MKHAMEKGKNGDNRNKAKNAKGRSRVSRKGAKDAKMIMKFFALLASWREHAGAYRAAEPTVAGASAGRSMK